MSVFQKKPYQIRRQGTRLRVLDSEPGSLCGSFLIPRKWHLQTCIPSSPSVGPRPWCRVLDSGKKWVVWNGSICKATVSLADRGCQEIDIISICSWIFSLYGQEINILLCGLWIFPLYEILFKVQTVCFATLDILEL